MARAKSIALYWGIRYYLKYCQEKHLTAKTLGWYEQKLTVFRVYMAQTHHIASAGSVTYQHVQVFLGSLYPMTDATVKGYIQVLKGFFKWTEQQGYTHYNPAKIAGDLWRQRN